MKILITGGTGFIGTGLIKRLSKDHQLFCIIRDKNKNTKIIEKYCNNIYYGDLLNFDFISRVVSDTEPDIVFHLASTSIVRICANNPREAYNNNIIGTVNLLDAIRQYGYMTKKIIVSTSDKVYGHALPPYDENTEFKPKYTYETTKACQDLICQNYYYNYDLPITIVRLGNVYGPDDENTSRLIPNTINRLLNNENPIIYEDVANYRRDFIYIEDAVDALELILKTEKNVKGEQYCIGSQNQLPDTIEEIVNLIIRLMKSNNQIEFKNRHNNFKEIESQYMNASKIRKLGWIQKTDLKKGLIKTIKSYKK